MTNWKKRSSMVVALVLAAGSLASCGQVAKPVGIDTANPTISIMTQANNTQSATKDSQVYQEIENYLGKKMSEKYGKNYDKVNLDISFVASSVYGEKVTAAMGAGEYPQVMLVTTRSSSVIQNSKHGTFWNLTDEYAKKDANGNPEYPHLALSNPSIIRNISVEGENYGVYRARTVGRQGMTYRQDWVDKLSKDGKLSFSGEPKTIADLNEMVEQFTIGDPDGNGQKDTYGMIITSFLDGPLDNLAIWCGSPNEWGYDEEAGQWKPWTMSEGFFEALTLVRNWYSKGYVNQNMISLDSNKWDVEFLNSKGGIQIDVADRARRNATKLMDADGNPIPDAVNVIGYVTKDKDTEAKIWPTTGYNGYYVMPKGAVADEKDLDFILSVLDEANSAYVVGLCNYGIEGVQYNKITEKDINGETITEDDFKAGKIKLITGEDGKAVKTEDVADLNQFSMGVVATKDYSNLGENAVVKVFDTNAARKVDEVQMDNEQYAVMNPMAPYTSLAYATSSSMLDSIISEAIANYMVGKIDENGYKDALNEWLKMDGDMVMKDYQTAYDEDPLNQKDGKVIVPDEYKFKFRF